MNHCDVGALTRCVGQISIYEMSFAQCALNRTSIASENVAKFLEQLQYGSRDLHAGGMESASRFVATVLKNIVAGQDVHPAALTVEARHVRERMTEALAERRFLRVALDRRKYLDKDNQFNTDTVDVTAAFPSARADIKDAGNCLAAECSTAAVFHLMRAAEVGLRALAYDRNVHVFKNAKTMFELPLELATWDQLINELEEAERAIQGFPQTLAREQQFDFYHGAMIQVRAFKNKFRNSIMHTRDSYDRDEALSAYNKVKEFMQILASKIKEDTRTPTIWT